MQTAFDRKSVLLKKQEAALKDFAKQTGLARDRAREQVSAHFDTKQGKTVAFNKSVSQKAVQTNKRALQIAEEKRIIKEIKEAGIQGKVSLHPELPDFQSLSFDAKHINERRHGVTFEEAVEYIKNARFTVTRWNGEFINYFSNGGATYVNVKSNLIRTAFKSGDYTQSVKKALEVLEKNGI